MINIFKKSMISLLSCTLFSYQLGSTAIVNAKNFKTIEDVRINENVYRYVNTYRYKYISRLSQPDQERYKKALEISLSSLTNISEKTINSVIKRIDMFAGRENGMVIKIARANFFDMKGITVDEFGATINAIILAFAISSTGGSAGGVKVAVKAMIAKYGKKTFIDMVAKKITKLGLGFLAGKIKQALPFLITLTSPGKAIAQFIDANDFYPNNGRINFWP